MSAYIHSRGARPAAWQCIGIVLGAIVLGALLVVGTVQARITSRTVANVPPDRTRTNLAVGEEVHVTIAPHVVAAWTATAGNVHPANGNSTLFTAPHSATGVTVTANIGMAVSNISFNILEPTGYLAPTNTAMTGLGVNVPSAGMTIELDLSPTNVSFYRVEIVEIGAVSTNPTGYFADTNLWPTGYLDHGSHGGDRWVPVNMSNHIGTDTAYSGVCRAPWANGHFSWPIPAGWRVNGDAVTNDLPWSDQDFTIDPAGTVTIDKFGHRVTRETNDVYTVVR